MSDDDVTYPDDSEQAPGTLILVDHGSRKTWHHSVHFDGYDHGTACGMAVDCDDVRHVCIDLSEWSDLDTSECCDECAGSVRSLCLETSQEATDE